MKTVVSLLIYIAVYMARKCTATASYSSTIKKLLKFSVSIQTHDAELRALALHLITRKNIIWPINLEYRAREMIDGGGDIEGFKDEFSNLVDYEIVLLKRSRRKSRV
jgi:hypothetical protein